MQGAPTHTQFWAKLDHHTGKDGQKTITSWHSLIAHSADVAACAQMLLSHTILNARFAQLLGLDMLSDAQIAKLCVFVALHDAGKVCHGFQDRAHEGGAKRCGHLAPMLDLCESDLCHLIFQDLGVLDAFQWLGADTQAELDLYNMWLATICHHGKPIQPTAGFHSRFLAANTRRDPREHLKLLGCKVKQWFPKAFSSQEQIKITPEFQHAFNGLVTLADWLGSDSSEGMFSFEDDPDTDRMSFARQTATHMAQRMFLDPRHARTSLNARPLNFETCTGFTPHHMQQDCMDLALHPKGSLTLLESDTGSGKTEAAVARFLALFAQGLVDGMYFALPTRTSAVQLHTRLTTMMRKAFPEDNARPPVVLAVPGYLQVDDATGTRLAPFTVQWDQDHRYKTWAAEHPKRYLAGPIVVGTIDQVLLSGLQVRHAHMRATALMRHFLVVDEVHASDVYMTHVLHQVLTHHQACGGHALLMSATLGSCARTQFFSPKVAPPNLQDAQETPYPALTHRAHQPEYTQPVYTQASLYTKRVHTHIRPLMEDIDALAKEAIDAAQKGARVLIIRNTVTDCIKTLEAVERHDPCGTLLFTLKTYAVPHHGRFAAPDRKALDRALEEAVGKRSWRQSVIVVATQTVEQSLDIDVDLLWTDLCPMDVLLQRIGRLHRHQHRERPPGFEDPHVMILRPRERALDRFLTPSANAHGLGTVYANMLSNETTLCALETHPLLTIPDDNRKLVEWCTHPEALEQKADALGNSWNAHLKRMYGQDTAHHVIADLSVLERHKTFEDQRFSDRLDERIQTRLGTNTRRAVLPQPATSPFGNTIHEFNIPGHMARHVSDDATVHTLHTNTHRISFGFGPHSYLYDHLGLRISTKKEEVAP